jgi:hypothetical protein
LNRCRVLGDTARDGSREDTADETTLVAVECDLRAFGMMLAIIFRVGVRGSGLRFAVAVAQLSTVHSDGNSFL